MITLKNLIIERPFKKSILADIFYTPNSIKKDVVIFCHGYKGFKDWGAWNLIAKRFVEEGFVFVKFNFSHNGGTIKDPIDFPDLEAFGHNNYSLELGDLKSVINWIQVFPETKTEIDKDSISLIGHSRGGGIVSILASEDIRVRKVISLAGVSDFKSRFNIDTKEFKVWQETGVKYIKNGRTLQMMPHYFQFYTDFVKNCDRLTIKRALSKLTIPHLIIHGNKDSSVLIEEALDLHSWSSKSKLEIVDNADHVFNTSHPWHKDILSNELKTAFDIIVSFIKSDNTE